jgi:hypothetical protein
MDKYLMSNYPELRDCQAIPVSIKFTQLFSAFIDEQGKPNITKDDLSYVSSSRFQTKQYFINGGHYKPISKLINIQDDFYSSENGPNIHP